MKILCLLPALLLLGAAPRAPRWEALDGPWRDGSYVDLAVGPDGRVHAVWLDGPALRYAAGPAWSTPVTVASGAEAGDGGQIRPEIVLDGKGEPAVLFAVGHDSRLARAKAGAWTTAAVEDGPGASALATLAVVGGEPVVAWLDTRRDPAKHVSALFVGGEEIWASGADGVCMCCKPALLVRPDGLAAAVRDADGPRRDVRLLVKGAKGWEDRGDATKGRWSPGGCPADGPALTNDAMYVSDARDGKRRIYRADPLGERVLPLLDPSAEAVQPRATPDGAVVTWVEVLPGKATLVLRDAGATVAVTTTPGRLEPGDPVVVGRELWLPYQGEEANVLVQRP